MDPAPLGEVVDEGGVHRGDPTQLRVAGRCGGGGEGGGVRGGGEEVADGFIEEAGETGRPGYWGEVGGVAGLVREADGCALKQRERDLARDDLVACVAEDGSGEVGDGGHGEVEEGAGAVGEVAAELVGVAMGGDEDECWREGRFGGRGRDGLDEASGLTGARGAADEGDGGHAFTIAGGSDKYCRGYGWEG